MYWHNIYRSNSLSQLQTELNTFIIKLAGETTYLLFIASWRLVILAVHALVPGLCITTVTAAASPWIEHLRSRMHKYIMKLREKQTFDTLPCSCGICAHCVQNSPDTSNTWGRSHSPLITTCEKAKSSSAHERSYTDTFSNTFRWRLLAKYTRFSILEHLPTIVRTASTLLEQGCYFFRPPQHFQWAY